MTIVTPPGGIGLKDRPGVLGLTECSKFLFFVFFTRDAAEGPACCCHQVTMSGAELVAEAGLHHYYK